MDKTVYSIGVRNLVEFLLRSGDLASGGGGFADKEAMVKGARIHRKIQASMGGNYQAEVPLVYRKEYEDFIVQLEGRADGLVESEDELLVDEIKGRRRRLEDMETADPLHLAQGKCYAWMKEGGSSGRRIRVQVSYCHMETEEIRRFQYEFQSEELESWFEDLLGQWYPWVKLRHDHKLARDRSMEGLEFPFPYRQGQRELAVAVYKTIAHKKELFIQAPTGVGKTMSVIFPAVRALGMGMGDSLFYLTARTVTGEAALKAFRLLRRKGLSFRSLQVTAREKVCVCNPKECEASACPRAKGHFDRVNRGLYEILSTEEDISRERIDQISEKYGLCPFELSLDLVAWADGLVCDYNYILDPRTRLKRHIDEGKKGRIIFLFDEAHNLPDRAREMYSQDLCLEEISDFRTEIPRSMGKLRRYLQKAVKEMLVMKRECEEDYRLLPGPGGLPLSLLKVQGELEKLLLEIAGGELHRRMLEFYFDISGFLRICDLLDERYVTYGYHDEKSSFHLRLFCMDPSKNIQSYLAGGRSTIFFSATFQPMAYYRRLIGREGEEDYGLYIDSPFPMDNRKLLISREVSSRYKQRGLAVYRKIAAYIRALLLGRRGKYMVFFPSYSMQQAVWEVCDLPEGYEGILQSPSMDEEERAGFLDVFRGEEKELVGFCVMGGIFSEGIDLVGDHLIGAAVVGTGLPGISREGEILKDYFEKKLGEGFAYAYRYPGMNKVLQAAGRVIRSPDDRGVILLLDDRFLAGEYRDMFPREWEEYQLTELSLIDRQLEAFWKEENKGGFS